jgi:polyphosphate kinase
MPRKLKYINREISWLSFNARVLQEAADESVPLVERFRFLGIFSNNLDEFFRVRVATVKRMAMLDLSQREKGYENPQKLLQQIQNTVIKLQSEFQVIYQNLLVKLGEKNIFVLNETNLLPEHESFVRHYFQEKVWPALVPIMVSYTPSFPYLIDKTIYLAVKFSLHSKKEKDNFQYALVEIPTRVLSRFLVLPSVENKKYIMLLDDVIRLNLNQLFNIFEYDKIEGYVIKITRDAELDFDNDVSSSFLEKIEKSLKKRKKGETVRFVYDRTMPDDLLKFLQKKMNLGKDDNMIPGGRYHNFKDFMKFPNVGDADLEYERKNPLPHPDILPFSSILNLMDKQDILLHYPYQSFNYIIDLLREAAIDPKVKSIKITLYRLAKNSQVINALINAAKNGKQVSAILELQARFDEEANIYWSTILQEEGVKVFFGVKGLKVHSKLCVISRKSANKLNHYVHIGTGNFNENTSRLYSDITLLTCDDRITSEVNKVFKILEGNLVTPNFRHLILSPQWQRIKLKQLINREIRNARIGKEAFIKLKLNSLVDTDLINLLYKAGKAGVKITLNIRGICCLVAGIEGLSENITAFSIVDQYLEHARMYVFCNDGNNLYYISSADWMARNIDRRIEVTCPIYEPKLQEELNDFFEIQNRGNVKARLLNEKQDNQYRITNEKATFRAQLEMYKYLKKKYDNKN